LLDGTLTDVAGCIGIDQYAVIWPHGTKVRHADPLTLAVPGSPDFVLGQPARVGGGVIYEPNAQPAKERSIAGVTVPPACVAAGVWMSSP
jgi:hypothetical protein